jgi:hypothetical protein
MSQLCNVQQIVCHWFGERGGYPVLISRTKRADKKTLSQKGKAEMSNSTCSQGSDNDNESRATTAGNKVRAKLPVSVQKQLAEDIERAGGLHSFEEGVKQGLTKLLDLGDSECYGARGSALRRKIGQKVFQWKRLKIQDYYQVLNKLQVVPNSQRPKSQTYVLSEFKSPPKKVKRRLSPETPKTPSTSTSIDVVQELISSTFANLSLSDRPTTPDQKMPIITQLQTRGTCARCGAHI